ncbi:MAG TPA: alpha/beta hydrolase fold domain-containing protein [Alphaproteobacteria bacterium]|jgi:acetyl esterase/lipase|nr:alpha/beta hydrolase fold domain-containing protein [Alphaproteobacteria bacterium]
MVSTTTRLAAGLALMLLAGCAQHAAPPADQAAAATAHPKPTVDADGTVHIPPIAVPVSGYVSPEFKATLHDIMTHPYPPIPKAGDPIEVYQAGREALNRDVYADVIRRAKARFAVDLGSETIAGVYADVVTPKDGIAPKNKNRILINLHGGAFYNGARTESLVESIPIAAVGKIKVVSLDYREGPEYKFPAASEDVAAVYRELLKHYKPKNIGIYGCSAGGTLTAEALAWLQKEKLPNPGAAGIFCAGAVRGTTGDSAYIAPPFAYAQMPPPPGYAGQEPGGYFAGTDAKDPLVSPAYDLGVLAKFPPTLILTATRDMALSAAVYTHSQLVKAGADSDLHVWEGLTHGFFGDPDLPESQDAYQVIVKFFDRHLGK